MVLKVFECRQTSEPASSDSFPRIPRCCRLQRDSRWRTVFQFSRMVWRGTEQVQLQHEVLVMADRGVHVGAWLLTWCLHSVPDGSLKTPTTPETSASLSSASACGTIPTSSTSSPSPALPSSLKPCSVSVAPLLIPDPSRFISSTESGPR